MIPTVLSSPVVISLSVKVLVDNLLTSRNRGWMDRILNRKVLPSRIEDKIHDIMCMVFVNLVIKFNKI